MYYNYGLNHNYFLCFHLHKAFSIFWSWKEAKEASTKGIVEIYIIAEIDIKEDERLIAFVHIPVAYQGGLMLIYQHHETVFLVSIAPRHSSMSEQWRDVTTR